LNSQSSQAFPAPVSGFFAVPSVASASAFVGNEGTAKNNIILWGFLCRPIVVLSWFVFLMNCYLNWISCLLISVFLGRVLSPLSSKQILTSSFHSLVRLVLKKAVGGFLPKSQNNGGFSAFELFFVTVTKMAKKAGFPVAASVPLQLTLKSESHDVTNLANLADLGLV